MAIGASLSSLDLARGLRQLEELDARAVGGAEEGEAHAVGGLDRALLQLGAELVEAGDVGVDVIGLDGKVLSHGANAKLIGKDLIDAQDVDGKYYVKERTELARKQADFWQDYKFVNPQSKKIEPKQMYCQRLGETAVCAGVYKG